VPPFLSLAVAPVVALVLGVGVALVLGLVVRRLAPAYGALVPPRPRFR
jgi:hypothetical protein